MAPRFTHNMFNCWLGDDTVDALVCFKCRADDLPALEEKHLQFAKILVARLSQGKPWERAASEQLPRQPLRKSDDELVVEWPPSAGRSRWRSPDLSICISTEYSYAIVVRVKGMSLGTLARHISETAEQMAMPMPKNELLPSLEAVMRSNRIFSATGSQLPWRDLLWAWLIVAAVLLVPAALVAALWPRASYWAFGIAAVILLSLVMMSLLNHVIAWRRIDASLKHTRRYSPATKNRGAEASGAERE